MYALSHFNVTLMVGLFSVAKIALKALRIQLNTSTKFVPQTVYMYIHMQSNASYLVSKEKINIGIDPKNSQPTYKSNGTFEMCCVW